jgi:hypothetical protein
MTLPLVSVRTDSIIHTAHSSGDFLREEHPKGFYRFGDRTFPNPMQQQTLGIYPLGRHGGFQYGLHHLTR